MLVDVYKINELLTKFKNGEISDGEIYNSLGVKGEITDIAHYLDSKGNRVRSEVLQEAHNIIVTDISKVLAGALANWNHVVDTPEAVTMTALDTYYSLDFKRLIPGTVVVKDVSLATTYTEDEDYIIDYTDGKIQALTGGSILAGNILKVTYSHYQNLYWAVGSGSAEWDALPDPSVNESQSDTQLVAEYFRKFIPASAIKFINDANEESVTVTNRIKIDLTFAAAEAVGDLREFAIVGFDASETANSGKCVNHKIHKRINKTDVMELQRILRITF